MTASDPATRPDRIPEPPECPLYGIEPGTPISTPEETRAAVMAFFEAGKRENVEEMDATMAPDATMWFAGYGCVDRSKWGPAHYTADRPKATFVRVELQSLLIEGDKAVLEMITERVSAGGSYLRYHSIHLWVSRGKIVSVRQYSVDARPAGEPGPMGRASQTK
jgi:ketosteroid isomerase-like protein